MVNVGVIHTFPLMVEGRESIQHFKISENDYFKFFFEFEFIH